MNHRTRFTVLALALALGSFSSLAGAAEAAAPASVAGLDTVKAVLRTPRLAPGANRLEVLQKLGRPQLEVSPTVWVYTGYHAESPVAAAESFTHLIVRFEGRRVVRLELAGAAHVAALQAPAADPHRALARQ